MKKVIIVGLVVLAVAIVGIAVNGKIAPLSWGLWGSVNLKSGAGAGGYDVVAYQVDGVASPGLRKHSSTYNGADWLFANAENKRLFDANPIRFTPMYGGFCAYAVYKNVTADVDPTVWHVEDGKLYLFASDGPRRSWLDDISSGAITTSDSNWAER